MLSTVIPLVMLLIPAGQDTLRVKEEKPGYRAEAKITGDAAMRSALSRVPGGHIESAELEKEKGRLVYSFDIVAKDGLHEVNIDANSGEVLENKIETPADEAKEKAEDAAKPAPTPY